MNPADAMDATRPNPGRALLLIDFQRDFLDDAGRMPVARHHVAPVLAATRRAIADARRHGDLIVRIGNEFRPRDVVGNLLRRRAAIAGSPGAAWDPRVDAGEAPYVPKSAGSAFTNPALDRILAGHGVGRLTVAGLFAQACVTATVRSALGRGLTVGVLTDAVACSSDASRTKALGRLADHGALLLTTTACPSLEEMP